MQMRNIPQHPASNSANPLRKIAGFVVTIVMIILVLMFSAVVFAVILVVGAVTWAYLWWKTRELRKQMRDFRERSAAMEGEVVGSEITRGEVIEGEVIRVAETRDRS